MAENEMVVEDFLDLFADELVGESYFWLNNTFRKWKVARRQVGPVGGRGVSNWDQEIKLHSKDRKTFSLSCSESWKKIPSLVS